MKLRRRNYQNYQPLTTSAIACVVFLAPAVLLILMLNGTVLQHQCLAFSPLARVPPRSVSSSSSSLSFRQQQLLLLPPQQGQRNWQPLASSFYGKFDDSEDDEDEDDEEDDEEDEDDYDLDDLDVASFRSKMSTLYGGDGESSSSSATSSSPSSSPSSPLPTSLSDASSVDELISFARSREPQKTTEPDTDWAIPTDKLEPGTVLLANPAKFCADFGSGSSGKGGGKKRGSTPSPSLLAKFGLTLPPPADLGADRRADLLPVLIIVSASNGNSKSNDKSNGGGGFQAVLLNRRTGYLLGDLESPASDSSSSGGQPMPMLEKFCIQPLWFGGVDNVSAGLDMLHQCPTVEGAIKLTDDELYWGGDPAQAQEAMSDSRLDRVFSGFDFKFFVQATVWSKGELEQHMEAENWFCAKVSKEVLFKSRDRMGTRKAKPLWAEIMELMGPEYKAVRDELYKDEL